MPPDSINDLHPEYESISEEHLNYLEKHGVRMPQWPSQMAIVLVFLVRNKGLLVSLESVRAFVRTYMPSGSKDIQPRHLKYAGWFLLLSGKSGDLLLEDVEYQKNGMAKRLSANSKLPNGHIMLYSTRIPSPELNLKKRKGSIDKSSWEAMIASYNGKCAVCNEKKAQLEKGHKDPTKGYDLDNIIPMCSDCNNWASSDLVFDDFGRIKALASPRFVKTSELEVKIRIFSELKKDRDVNPSAKK